MGSYAVYKIEQLENKIAELERVLAESQKAQTRDQRIATARGWLLWKAEKKIRELEAEVAILREERQNNERTEALSKIN